MMMITAMILATGPSIDSRIRCSGSSHGMDEPAAWAWAAHSSTTPVRPVRRPWIAARDSRRRRSGARSRAEFWAQGFDGRRA